jgi:hypothetical protein
MKLVADLPEEAVEHDPKVVELPLDPMAEHRVRQRRIEKQVDLIAEAVVPEEEEPEAPPPFDMAAAWERAAEAVRRKQEEQARQRAHAAAVAAKLQPKPKGIGVGNIIIAGAASYGLYRLWKWVKAERAAELEREDQVLELAMLAASAPHVTQVHNVTRVEEKHVHIHPTEYHVIERAKPGPRGRPGPRGPKGPKGDRGKRGESGRPGRDRGGIRCSDERTKRVATALG